MTNILETPRLFLRPFVPADAPTVQQLAGDYEIARTTLHVPHPYPDGAAEAWIEALHEAQQRGKQYGFAVVRQSDRQLIGAMSLSVQATFSHAEIAYWIGRSYWGQGYATEAGRRVVRFGFEELHLHRIFATVFATNPASARVLQKLGMQYEGTQREHVSKWGSFLDLQSYGRLQGDPEPLP